MAEGFVIRGARPDEVDAILALFEDDVRAGKMLPRHPGEVRAHIGDWIVAEGGEGIVGCVSLVFYNDDLCELRSLAVGDGYRGNGLGSKLIQAAVDLAERRKMKRVLSLTRAIPLFEKMGFQFEQVMNFPEKVWRDCRPCPRRHRCDEVALVYHVEQISLSTSGKGKGDDHSLT